MKVCVCSDSHGNAKNLDKMLLWENPDVVLFLGDGVQDFLDLTLPSGCTLHAVAGNCDFYSNECAMRVFELEGIRMLMVHGHRQAVKDSLFRLSLLAEEQGADIVMYGHTHVQNAHWEKSRLFLCPGSIGSALCSYAVLECSSGKFELALKNNGKESI